MKVIPLFLEDLFVSSKIKHEMMNKTRLLNFVPYLILLHVETDKFSRKNLLDFITIDHSENFTMIQGLI